MIMKGVQKGENLQKYETLIRLYKFGKMCQKLQMYSYFEHY